MKRILIVLIVLLLLTSLGAATTLKVGKTSSYKYHTIQSAVNVSHTGDTILVANGYYPEVVNFKKVQYCTDNPLKIQGAMVNGKYVYPRVYGFDMGHEEIGADINGFNITRFGIVMEPAHIIKNNYFENCGIILSNQFTIGAQIINNKFTNGTIDVGMDVMDCTIKGCTFSKSKIGLYTYGAAEVSNCVFLHCTKGVSVGSCGKAGVRYNTFEHCTEGVVVDEYGRAIITNNKFLYCVTGIHIFPYGDAYMNRNTYTGNKEKIIRDPTPA